MISIIPLPLSLLCPPLLPAQRTLELVLGLGQEEQGSVASGAAFGRVTLQAGEQTLMGQPAFLSGKGNSTNHEQRLLV